MSTSESSTETWPCGCGQGLLIYDYETPDHTYNPRTTCTGFRLDCVDCAAKFEVRTDSSEVEGAPPPEPGFEFRFFVDKQEAEERRQASRAEATARGMYDRIVLSLRNEAETKLTELSSSQRYAALCEMFGFLNVDVAKEFVARRRPHAVVKAAVSVAGKLEHLAQYFGRTEELRRARDAIQGATATAERLGRPPVREISRRKKFSISDVFSL